MPEIAGRGTSRHPNGPVPPSECELACQDAGEHVAGCPLLPGPDCTCGLAWRGHPQPHSVICAVITGRGPSSEGREHAGMTPTFHAALLAFLRAEGIDAVTVEDSAWGTDWAGGTEGGFYSTFSTDLAWTTVSGERGIRTYEGEDMARLWQFVMRYEAPDA